jgi:hypothetical protein
VEEVPARSLGYALDAGPVACGVVHSVFRHAVNVMMCGEMWTLLAEGKSDLPFGIRVALPDFDALGLRRGETVHVRSGFMGIGSRLVVDCRATARWVPARVLEPAPGLMRRLAMMAKLVRGRSWSGSAEMALAVKSAMHSPAAIGVVLAKVVGCGPGATPSGDDVLVGILAVLTSTHSKSAGAMTTEVLPRASAVNPSPRPAGERKLAGGASHRIRASKRPAPAGAADAAPSPFLRPRRGWSHFAFDSGGWRHRLISLGPPGHSQVGPHDFTAAVGMRRVANTRRTDGTRDAELLRGALLPLLPTTNDVSAHLLRQAAHGLLSRDLHELVSALIGNSSPAQLRDAVQRVVETGATSGADTCEGLLAFAPSYFIQQHAMAAA